MSARIENYVDYRKVTGRSRGVHNRNQHITKDQLERSIRGTVPNKLKKRTQDDVEGFSIMTYIHTPEIIDEFEISRANGVAICRTHPDLAVLNYILETLGPEQSTIYLASREN